jgi:outer membrane protein assembly factor BamB
MPKNFSKGIINQGTIISNNKINQHEMIGKNNCSEIAWKMFSHDLRHTGRSPYSTIGNPGIEKWRFDCNDWVEGSGVIDSKGILYIPSYMRVQAIYPNGTLKWRYWTEGWHQTGPAIGNNNVIYIGTSKGFGQPSHLAAIFTENGTLKWKFNTKDIYSSPSIGNDGAIYFGDSNHYINALNTNGSVKWRYKTNNVVYSSPAISEDGTIYCGSHDTYLYALYPNNGTLKWKFKTGGWIRTNPCIADDGTIYVVSLDNYLYAIRTNGTLKWKTSVGAGTSPTIAQDGTIYCGYDRLYALYPNNGSIKWIFTLGQNRKIRGGTPCNSIDGAIYLGTNIGDYDGGEIIAINSYGSEIWRKIIANEWVEFAPIIDSEGTVYIGSSSMINGDDGGYLHAFGIGELEAEANGPYYGLKDSELSFSGMAYNGSAPFLWNWTFGDGYSSTNQNPIHIYNKTGNYSVTLTVNDETGNASSDLTWAWIQEGNNPPTTPVIDGRIKGNPEIAYEYTFESSDPEGTQIWYYIDWGDGTSSGWLGPYSSGTILFKSHSWEEKDSYSIRCKAKDVYDDESDWGVLDIQIPYSCQYPCWQWLCERFPVLTRFLNIFF